MNFRCFCLFVFPLISITYHRANKQHQGFSKTDSKISKKPIFLKRVFSETNINLILDFVTHLIIQVKSIGGKQKQILFSFRFFFVSYTSSKKKKGKKEWKGWMSEGRAIWFHMIVCVCVCVLTFYNFLKHIVKPCEARRVYSCALRCTFSFISHMVFFLELKACWSLSLDSGHPFFFSRSAWVGGKKKKRK